MFSPFFCELVLGTGHFEWHRTEKKCPKPPTERSDFWDKYGINQKSKKGL